jgi:hypothetical protein
MQMQRLSRSQLHLRLPGREGEAGREASVRLRPELPVRTRLPLREGLTLVRKSTGSPPNVSWWPHLHSISNTSRSNPMLRKFILLLSFAGLAALSACMSPPTGLNLSLDRPTTHFKYRVAVHPLANPIAINKMLAFEIRLRSVSGEAVSGAKISVDGGMPQHGHGFPTQPKVTKELGDGRYLLEGMKFSMPGWWEIKLKFDAPSGSDEITFNMIVSLRAAPLVLAGIAVQP